MEEQNILEAIKLLGESVNCIDNIPIKDKLQFYVIEDYQKICYNEDDYDFKIKRCVRTFLHFYFEYYKDINSNDILKKAVKKTIDLCPWLYNDIYSKDMMENNKNIINSL
jgi:hypothetical protein